MIKDWLFLDNKYVFNGKFILYKKLFFGFDNSSMNIIVFFNIGEKIWWFGLVMFLFDMILFFRCIGNRNYLIINLL